jgi:uncharacterized DUF497 family protein
MGIFSLAPARAALRLGISRGPEDLLRLTYTCTYNQVVGFEWDPVKAASNVRKHERVHFEEAKAIFDDPFAITIPDDDSEPGERRFVSIGMGALGRVLVVVYTWRGEQARIISARLALHRERREYEEDR